MDQLSNVFLSFESPQTAQAVNMSVRPQSCLSNTSPLDTASVLLRFRRPSVIHAKRVLK